MKKTRILVIGLNPNHSEHILALKSNPSVDVIAVCDINSSISKNVSSHFNNVPCFSDYREAINLLEPDAIFLSLPHYMHLEVVEFALKNNIHIFKEKPFSYDLDEAQKMSQLFKFSHSKLMTVSQRRFHQTYLEAKNMIGELGKVKYVFASYCFNKPTSGWRKNKKASGGGVIIDSGYHLIDLLMYYFGLPKSVKCHLSKLSDDASCETEDYAKIELKYPDSKVIQLVLNRMSETKQEEVVIFGELGKLTVNKNEILLDIFDSGISKKTPAQNNNYIEAYQQQHASFFSSLSGKLQPTPGIKEGILNSLIIEACYLSARENDMYINTEDLLNSRGIHL